MKAALATHPVKHEPAKVEPAKPAPAPVKAKAVALAKVGDIVEYYTKDLNQQTDKSDGPYAALVTKVDDGTVDLFVFPSGDVHSRPYHVMAVANKDTEPQWFQAR
jgi:hypothetical protein